MAKFSCQPQVRIYWRLHSNSCFFTMVAVDDNGKAVAVPQLVPRTDDQIRRFANGKERRAIRAELEERYRELHKK